MTELVRLLASFGVDLPWGASIELEEALSSTIVRARSAWPGVDASDACFLRHLAPWMQGDPLASLERLHTSDLYLVAACLEGDARALAVFNRTLVSLTKPMVVRMHLSADVADEARQILRARFFGEQPKIAEYAGTGPLSGWLRAAFVREALRVMRVPRARVEIDRETLDAIASPKADLEIDYLKRLYGAEVHGVLRESFGRLDVRERNILRQYFSIGMTIDDLATFYRVHRTTASRWVTKARDALVEETKGGLRQKLNLEPEDVSSILRLIRSQIEDAIHSLLVET
jgi:RNA polymerase sigma-70 factor (ECF subfamily)